MRFLRGQTPRQIGRALDVPVKTMHTRIERGLAQLRGKLDREFGGDRGAWVVAFAPLIDRGGLSLGLGSLVIPMNMKLIAAGLGVVAILRGARRRRYQPSEAIDLSPREKSD